jgi:hypothetical protein
MSGYTNFCENLFAMLERDDLPEEELSIFDKKEFVKQYDFCMAHEDNPLNEPHVFDFPEGMEFVLTMKNSLDFECQEAENTEEDMTKFSSFAMRKSGLTIVKFYRTEAEVKTLDRAWYFRPYAELLFLWDKEGKMVNGAY